MSDRNPKVKVEAVQLSDRFQAFCCEPDCTWTQAPDAISYVMDRAKAHRKEHREIAAAEAERQEADRG